MAFIRDTPISEERDFFPFPKIPFVQMYKAILVRSALKDLHQEAQDWLRQRGMEPPAADSKRPGRRGRKGFGRKGKTHHGRK